MGYHLIESLEDYYMLHTTSARDIILYTASWCRPCKELKAFLHEEYPELEIPLLIVDVEHPDLSDLVADVQAMPTLEFYQEGKLVHRIEGFTRSRVRELVEEWLQ
jgi:thiol-disulfide isomerase/thioredoxin